MKHTIFKKRHSIVLIIGSLAFGFKLLNNPDLYETMAAYRVLYYALDVPLIAWLFIFATFVKALGVILNNIFLKIGGLGALAGLWFMIFLSLAIQDFQGGMNAGFIFTAMIVLDCICIAVEEVVR